MSYTLNTMEKKEEERLRNAIETVLRAILFLSIAGCILSLYLLTTQFYGLGTFCSINDRCDCDNVIDHPQSSIAGIPLSLLSLEGYLVMIVITGILIQRLDHKMYPQHRARRINLLIMFLALAGFVGMTYFTYVQAYAIGAWCVLHVILYVLITAILALSIINYVWRKKYSRMIK